MSKTLLAAAAIALAATSLAKAATLADLRWEKRIVIVFGTEDEPRIAEQERRLQQSTAGLAERDLVAFAVVGDAVQAIEGTPPSGETAASLRRRFDVGPDTPFEALLIGKDGGVKWRGDQPIAQARLEAIVDAMPMRRNGQ